MCLLAWTQVQTVEVGGSPGEPRATSDPLLVPPAQTRSQNQAGRSAPHHPCPHRGSEDANPKSGRQGAQLAPCLPCQRSAETLTHKTLTHGSGAPASKTCTLNDKGQRPGHRKPRKPSSQLQAAAGDTM